MNDKHDLTFYNIVKEENSFVSFLDSVFGFLFRCTDFYHGQTGTEESPSQVAEDLVIKTFKKYQALANNNEKDDVQFNLATSDSEIPAACQEIVLETEYDPQLDASVIGALTLSSSSEDETVHFKLTTSESDIPAACQEIVLESAHDPQLDTSLAFEEIGGPCKSIDENEEFFNGDDRGLYKWSQSLTDVDITIPTPKRISKGSQVKVDMTSSSLMIQFLSENEEDWENVLDMILAFNIVPNDSYWSLIPGSHLQLNLEKKDKQWWDHLSPCDPPLDPRKIDTSELEGELSDYDRMKIQEAISMSEQPNIPG